MVVKNLTVPLGLGVNNGKLFGVPKSPNAVSSFSEDLEKYVEPFKFKSDLISTKASIKKALEGYGNIEIKSESDKYIYAVSKTKIGFRDDLEFLFDEQKKVVYFRSASRVGYYDMGLNKKRYEKLVELYEKTTETN